MTSIARQLTPEQRALVESHAIVVDSAVKSVMRLARSPSDVPDLFGHANLTLCEAARDFDPNRGVQFRTYAQKCCLRALRDFVMDLGIIHTKSWLRNKKKAENPLQAYARRARSVCGLMPTHDVAGNSASLEKTSQVDVRLDVRSALDALRMDRSRWVIERYMAGWTDRKIADYLGLDRTAAWHIRKDATEDLRQWFMRDARTA